MLSVQSHEMTAPFESDVAEFLKLALAEGPCAVPKLEATARAAGLLGERQRITDAKVFKRAKQSVGIKSVRAGFGGRGEWRWQLPFDRRVESPSISHHAEAVSRPSRSHPNEIKRDMKRFIVLGIRRDIRLRAGLLLNSAACCPTGWTGSKIGSARLAMSISLR